MKRIQSGFTIIFAVILVGVVVAFLLHNRTPEIPKVQVPDDTPSGVKIADTNKGASALTNIFAQSTSPASDQNNEREMKWRITPDMTREQVQQILSQMGGVRTEEIRKPLKFYGMVIDENSNAVSGVGASFNWNEPLPNTPQSISTLTDQRGVFTLDVFTGRILWLTLEKDGYYISRRGADFNFQFPPNIEQSPNRPDPNNPIVFHLHRKGSGTDLISASLNVQIPRDGTPVNVDFINRNFGASGQLQTSQIKPNYESWKTASEWSFRMSISSGGFVEENDEFPFLAPENGYQPIVEFVFKADQPDWQTALAKSYYIVFGSPQRYGRLDLQTDIKWGGARVTFSINPTGARNLEPLP
jgi:hypothetical protein